MIDVVLPFRHSRWDDTEIKFCLRSIEKYLSGYNKIYIIGDKPRSVPYNYVHVPFADDHRRVFKERNIYEKLMWAVNSDEVSEDFLFMNDDHFLLTDYNACEFPNYYGQWPENRNDMYGATLTNTRELKPDAKFWDLHCPMLFNKQRFRETVASVDWNKKNGYCLKTLYADGLDGQHYEDLKIYYQYPVNDLRAMVEGRKWFSIDDGSRGPELLQILHELYPEKSIHEK